MMKCGATYTAVITELNSTGAKVKLQNGVKGLIDIIHLSEVPLRHPEKKFKIGDILTCRVSWCLVDTFGLSGLLPY